MEQVHSLRIIHVTGTKGKGSTCAFTESILKSHGFATGLFSSPHLISVRERFRINGEPITESTFCYHFWKLYKILDSKKDHEQDMPQYFKFLTIMMFHVFLEAKVDLAIVEVGIGGENDCTNVITNPICTGISSLGLDHTSVLGNTIEEIACQKSGIFKRNAPAFTVPQCLEAMNMLEKRAVEKNCSLEIAPSLENYEWSSGPPNLGIPADIQKYNASLALQLSSCWMESIQKIKRNLEDPLEKIIDSKLIKNSFSLEKAGLGISSCRWPGRTQILRGGRIDFFIDGAHTLESITFCASWFKESTRNESGKRFLIFNSTGNRDSKELIKPLRKLEFCKAVFTPSIVGNNINVDQKNWKVTTEEVMIKCRNNCEIWGDGGLVVDNVEDAINVLDSYNSKLNFENGKSKVLITGSMHLVGAALFIIDPNLSMTTKLF